MTNRTLCQSAMAASLLMTASSAGALEGPSQKPRPVPSVASPLKVTSTRSVDCARNSDQDEDSYLDIACGGNDCDDGDALRNPGASERCDGLLADGRSAATHDEDCDPRTVVFPGRDGDRDGDGFPSYRCSNLTSSGDDDFGSDPRLVRIVGRTVVGVDCNDDLVAIVPGSMWCADGHTVQICLQGGRQDDARRLLTLAPGAPLGSTPGSVRVACPPTTQCLVQPNGTGVCAR